MNRTGTPEAQRLSRAFDQFNEVSEHLASSYRRLEHRMHELGTRIAEADDRERLRRLEEEARGLERILDAIPAGVVVLDGDGRVRHGNPAAVELLGSPLLGVAWREVIDRAFVPCREPGDLKLKDGRVVTSQTQPLGTAPGQVILLSDVTESRAVQSLLQRHQRLSSMGDMVASLAHQLRTPLTSSLLYLAQLERGTEGTPRGQRCIAKIRGCLEHLEHLVKDMLVFAHGGHLADAEEIDVAGLLRDVDSLMAPQLQRCRCRLEMLDQAGGARVLGSRNALLAALQNLVTNAIQACGCRPPGDTRDTADGESGRLQLLARRIADRSGMPVVEIRVSDDGPGVPEEIRERVFDPFFTTKADGTGLGLPVVRTIVQSHNGAVWMTSGPEAGTTVIVRLPVASGSLRSEEEDA